MTTTSKEELKDQKNGTGPDEDQETDEDKIVETISLDKLQAVDLDLPEEFNDEYLAAEMLNIIQAYHMSNVRLKANRHQDRGAEAEKARVEMVHFKTQAAIIQSEHPGTVPIYKELATIRAKATKKARANQFED